MDSEGNTALCHQQAIGEASRPGAKAKPDQSRGNEADCLLMT
jgi:hypothetical protein